MNISFKPGNNIAMKVPPHEYEATLEFYRNVMGFKELTPENGKSPRFDFGGKILWIDCVETCSHAELWLEVFTENPTAAAEYLEQHGVLRCDEIEPLPKGFHGYWIKNPSNIVHLVSDDDAT